MSHLTFDPSQKSLRKVLKKWEETALSYFWNDEFGKSSQVWKYVNEQLSPDETISRASIINFLNDMVDYGVLNFNDATGKGGHHRVYFALMSKKGYTEYIAKSVIGSLLRDFQAETKSVIKDLID